MVRMSKDLPEGKNDLGAGAKSCDLRWFMVRLATAKLATWFGIQLQTIMLNMNQDTPRWSSMGLAFWNKKSYDPIPGFFFILVTPKTKFPKIPELFCIWGSGDRPPSSRKMIPQVNRMNQIFCLNLQLGKMAKLEVKSSVKIVSKCRFVLSWFILLFASLNLTFDLNRNCIARFLESPF